MKKMTKILCAVMALVLAVGCGVGGTLAWLSAKTNDVVNTFTYGDIDLKLEETTGNNYDIIPGVDIKKDPKVTVSTPVGAKAVDAWVFVKVNIQNWPEYRTEAGQRKVAYRWANEWMQLGAAENGNVILYREVAAEDEVKEFPVLAGDCIVVSNELTKEEVDKVYQNQPVMTFTAYAVQMAKNATETLSPAEAWAIVKDMH